MAQEAAKKEKKAKVPRQSMPEQAPAVRARNFEEVPLGLDAEAAMLEAQRCLQCKKPACVEGCPVGVDIPGFIKLVRDGIYQCYQQNLGEKQPAGGVWPGLSPGAAMRGQLYRR